MDKKWGYIATLIVIVSMLTLLNFNINSLQLSGNTIYTILAPFFVSSAVENSIGTVMTLVAISTNPVSETGDVGLNPYFEGVITVNEPGPLSFTDTSTSLTSILEGYDGSAVDFLLATGLFNAAGIIRVNEVTTQSAVTGLATFTGPAGNIPYFLATNYYGYYFGTNRFYYDTPNELVPLQNMAGTTVPVCVGGNPSVDNGIVAFSSTINGIVTSASICTTGISSGIFTIPANGGTPACVSPECQGAIGNSNAIEPDIDGPSNYLTYVSNRQNPNQRIYTLVVRDLSTGIEQLPHSNINFSESNPTLETPWVAVERSITSGVPTSPPLRQIVPHDFSVGTPTTITPISVDAQQPDTDDLPDGTLSNQVLAWVQLNPTTNLYEVRACFPNAQPGSNGNCQTNQFVFTDGVNSYDSPAVRVKRTTSIGEPIFDIVVSKGPPGGSPPYPFPTDPELWSRPTPVPQFTTTQVQLTSTQNVIELSPKWTTGNRIAFAAAIDDPPLATMIDLDTVNLPITSNIPQERADYISLVSISYNLPSTSSTGNIPQADRTQDHVVPRGFKIDQVDISTPNPNQINMMC